MISKFSTFISSFNPQTKGKQFEVFVKWFLENDPVWKSEVDKVWLWDDYPNRWGKDCGIDLVFKDKNNEIWAVQAKCYDREYPVKKSDVDKFLSESNRSLIQRRLLIATTDNLGPNARKVCADQEKPVTLFLYSDFEDSAIDYPESISDLSRTKLKPKPTPRDHQKEAIEKVAKGFKDANKGQLIMACGTGKTFTTLWIKEKLKADLTLILLPSLSLLSQTLKEWTFGMNAPFKSLAVCSDETVTKGASEDRLLESVQDLSFPVTSDISLIADFLKSSGNRVIFSTYQSSRLIAEAQKKKNIPSFDLAIADEAHRCAGNVASAFTAILNDDLIKTKLKLFTTATPRTYSSGLKKQSKDLDFEIVGMDDEKVFGKEFHRLSFGEAIDKKLLTDYQLVIIGVDEPMIAELIKHRELLKTDSDEIIDAKSLAAEIGVIKAIRDYDLKRILSFHSRVQSAEDFSKELPNVLDLIDTKHKPNGKIATGFVSGKMATNYRRQKLEQLKELSQSDYAVLSNARCLSEGVDVPALDGIAIIDPKASHIDIVQTVGRAIRLSENKSVGTIILPVFIENGDDPELSIESTNFKPVWDVLKALRSHDEMLAFELDTLRTEMGRQRKRTAHVGGLKKIVIDVPASVDSNFSNALRTYLVENTTASWNFMYGLLSLYEHEAGNCLVPLRYKDQDDNPLGSWVSTQRKTKNLLSPERVRKLESLNGWSWSVLEDNWNQSFEDLKVYYNLNKTYSIPKNYISPNGIKLSSWLSTQKNIRFELSQERITKLENLENWAWDALDQRWENCYNQLKDYSDKHGNLMVPSNLLSKDKIKLGQWMTIQRRNKKISAEKKSRLEALKGWSWNPIDANWEIGLEHFLKYKKEFGNISVPANYISADGFKLRNWLGTQRANYKNKIIKREHVLKLEAIEGWVWNELDEKWNKGYTHLKIFSEINKHSSPVATYLTKDGFRLGQWVQVQRSTKDNLSEDRIQKLNDLNFVWDLNENAWMENVKALIAYKKEFGDCKVPALYKTNNELALGSWVSKVRTSKNLSLERKKQLDSLEFIWEIKKSKTIEYLMYLNPWT